MAASPHRSASGPVNALRPPALGPTPLRLIRWLSHLRLGAADPLATLKSVPDPEVARAVAQEWQEQDQIDALRVGAQVLLRAQSVSYGTRGYSLRCLELAGLMTSRPVVCIGQGPAALYAPTDLGLAQLASHLDHASAQQCGRHRG